MKRHKLLIVDDIPENIDVLYGVLKEEYDVYSATTGRKALQIAVAQRPDLILLDVMMPEMNGYEVCAALKENDGTADIPVIFITARTDAASECQALAAGGVDFIAKPIAPEVVRAHVRLHLEVAQHRHHLQKLVAQRTRELAAALQAVEGANRTKSAFLATMSHELRTPLNAILGNSEILLEGILGDLNGKQRNALTQVEQSGRHLLRVLTGMLDLATIAADRMPINPVPVLCDDICRTAMTAVRTAAQDKQIVLSLICRKTPESLVTDPRRAHQILENLLTNAVKFTPEGGTVSLTALGDPEQRLVSFVVTDSGIGIAAEDLDLLFQPFTQVDSRLERRYEGIGIGLALVTKLSALLGGSIAVESEPGKGSRFTVTLPYESPGDRRPAALTDATRQIQPG